MALEPSSLADALSGAPSDPAPAYSPSPAGKAALKVAATENQQKHERSTAMMDTAQREYGSMTPPKMLQLPPEPHTERTSPGEQWGSLAMMFAAFGSLATRRPFTSAMNSAAAVMNAYNVGDTARAKQEFEKWKVESENAERMATFEHQQYQDKLSHVKTGVEFAKAAAPSMASLKESAAQSLMNAGRYDEAMQLLSGRGKAAGGLGGARQMLMKDFQMRGSMFEHLSAARNEFDAAQKSGDPQRVAHAKETLDSAQQIIKDYDYATTKGSGVLNYEERRRHDEAGEQRLADQLDELKRKNGVVEGQTNTRLQIDQGRANETTLHNRTTEGQTLTRLGIEQQHQTERERHDRMMEGLAALKPESDAAHLQVQRERLAETQRHNHEIERLSELKPQQTPAAQKYDATVSTAIDAVQRAIKITDDSSTKKGPPVTGLFGVVERGKEFVTSSLGVSDDTPATDFRAAIRQAQAEIPAIIAFGHMSAAQKKQMDDYVAGLGSVTSAKQANNVLRQLNETLEHFRRAPPPEVGFDPNNMPQFTSPTDKRLLALPPGSYYRDSSGTVWQK